MNDNTRNQMILLCNTREGREFLTDLLLEKCGFDISNGVTINKKMDHYDLGKLEIATSIYNDIIECAPDVIKKINREMVDYGK